MCTGNACRSQMAEGWARQLQSKGIEPYSAGVIKLDLDPRAVQVMAEHGVDISSQYSKTVDELSVSDFDAVVTLCDLANESCPFFPGQVKRLHQSFDDPPGLSRALQTEAEALGVYRRVCDELRAFVLDLPQLIE
jgi:arsenate reductase